MVSTRKITQIKGFLRKGIEKASGSVPTYVYLVLTSQVQARLSIVYNSMCAMDAQQVFNSTFTSLINEGYSIGADIGSYQSILECVVLKVDFSRGTSIYMLPSNLNPYIE